METIRTATSRAQRLEDSQDYGSGFRVEGLGCLGFRVQGLGVWGSGFRGLGLRVVEPLRSHSRVYLETLLQLFPEP